MQPTDTTDPDYYHKVVDCQFACPAHTNVPGYIRLIAQGRFDDAYMMNRHSNVFPGILGRVCDRPCEPACRRDRVEDKPVAICRLKRVAADLRGDITDRLPEIPAQKNGKRVAMIGAGCASLAVANDLMPLGYEVVIYEALDRAGGLMWTNIPAFRLPPAILQEEIDYIVDMGVTCVCIHPMTACASCWRKITTPCLSAPARPRARIWNCPAAMKTPDHIHIGIRLAGIAWLSNTSTKSARMC